MSAEPPEPSAQPEPGAQPEPSRGPAPSWPPAGARDQTMHWRTAVLLISAFATVLLGSVLMLLPVPFVVLRPGPAINTLGSEDGHQLITVNGHASYPAAGALDLTTVTVSGGPGSRLLLFEALNAWFDHTLTVAPQDDIYPPGQSVETSRAQDQQDMISSQESATVAALHELGIEVPATLTIDSVDASVPGSPLRAKDVITAVGGVAVPDLDALTTRIRQIKAGTRVAVTVRRGGVERVVQAPTREYDRHTVLGIRLDPAFHPPFQVTIRIDNVGGPSAGTMFALGIIDLLTPGDLTGGQKIAGTGTINVTGTVGPIGGIVQKMNGARRAGVTWFLAPADDCDQAAGHVPAGLRVVRISNLKQAHQAVQQIAAGTAASLPGCR